jgi:predicted GNAT family acetyltransferase
MDDLLIRNSFYNNDEIVKDVYSTLRKESNLSRRSVKELNRYIKNKELYCLYEKKEFIGFILRTKRSNELIEVHGMYIKPSFRGLGYSKFLMDDVTKDKAFSYLGAVFSQKVKDRLISWGFKEIPFSSLKFREKVSFLKARFKIHRLLEVKRHFSEKKELTFFIK